MGHFLAAPAAQTFQRNADDNACAAINLRLGGGLAMTGRTINDPPPDGAGHIPVMLREVLDLLHNHLPARTKPVIVDGTFGAGGYSRAIADAIPARVIGFDQDPEMIERAQSWLPATPGIELIHARFSSMIDTLAARDLNEIDALILDLGVSSFVLDQAERGFSFQADGPLDMRMGQSGPTAADLVNGLPENELADVFYQLGDERASRRIARAIVKARTVDPIQTTRELASIVAKAMPGRTRHDKIHPATRTFQALRIAVNDELGELARALDAARVLLSDGGLLIVVSFHSGEDRIAKKFLDEQSGRQARGSRHLPVETTGAKAAAFELITRKPLTAQADETAHNPRARSAKLRAARRIRVDLSEPTQREES